MAKASHQEDEKRSGPGPRALRRWTVLVVDDLGKIVSFEIGKPWAVGLTALLAAAIVIFIYGVVSYNAARTESKHLAEQLNSVTEQLADSEKAKEKALVRLLMLEGGLDEASKAPGSVSKGESGDRANQSRRSAGQGGNALKRAPEAGAAGDRGSPSTVGAQPREAIPAGLAGGVAVKDLEIWQEQQGPRFKYQFIVRNTNRKGGRVSGHTFVVLNPRAGSGASARVAPKTSLRDGRPGVFNKGQAFSIARYKFVRGTLAGVKRMDPFESATVYVFSDKGEILEETTFKINDVFRS